MVQQASSDLSVLSPTELEVSRLVAAGWPYARIADSLAMAEGTVKTHVWRTARKLPGDGPPAIKITRYYSLLSPEAA